MTTTTPPLFPLEAGIQTTDDHYTPAWVFQALGLTFDLDVCAPAGGVPWIPATRHFSLADDGLSQPWEGRVWMNPPFSNVAPWKERWLDHGHGVALLPFTKAPWCLDVWNAADGIMYKGKDLSYFVRGDMRKDINYCCFLAALGADCVEAIGRIGRAR